ncbi:shikimate dehydrogenase [Marinobacterium lutimaris]|uniref:Shikimate dehydrogenase (NADP(+)) n=1 Tax=Marinobacterium lutimaris TaxID=568106 RepID=A0A1H6DGM1_9GAMM|nr:shikimate dehydrogenase [Marinobacterium lutimaris]SEG84364.1 shikimate dehydrogenase [Marinobacterium lutimaris]
MSDRYAVFGNPINHSKSPQIHAAFAVQTGEAVEYSAQCIDEDQFEASVEAFFREGGKGLNITVPFKQRAWTMAQWRSPAAERAGAVNTLYMNEQGQLCGDNTDGIGLVCDLENHRTRLQGARVLILGAGGAVRGVLEPFLSAGAAQIVIANRTASKAHELAQAFGDLGVVSGCGFKEIDPAPFDLVLNGTSASLQGDLPPIPVDVVARRTTCYDMMYGAKQTPFCAWSAAAGSGKVMDGLGMLVEQAAESFRIWRGVKPQTAEVIEVIRRQLSAN